METNPTSLVVLTQAAEFVESKDSPDAANEVSSTQPKIEKVATFDRREAHQGLPHKLWVKKNHSVSQMLNSCAPAASSSNEADDDQPLDMSVKKTPQQQFRPSVITCAPPRPRSPLTLPDQSSDSHPTTTKMSLDACDPVIEEHFRRSLGKDYPSSQSKPVNVSMTVDDHFAKALGDKWAQLQQSQVSPSPPPPSKPPPPPYRSVSDWL